jgi:single-strand DNA-binding protein
MSQEVTGTIKLIKDIQTFASGFEKREIIVTITDGKYDQDIKFELLKDDVVKSDQFKVGQSVKVSYNLRGNYYEPKDAYYNSLQAWRLELDGEQHEPQDEQQEEREGSDSLPF